MAALTPIDGARATANNPQGERAQRSEEQNRREPAAPTDSAAVKDAIEQSPTIVYGSRNIEFNYREDVNRVVVTVKSGETDEVVRQIPPEDYLTFVARFRELIGVGIDEVA